MILKNTTVNGKKTVTLEMDEKEFSSISHLFAKRELGTSTEWYSSPWEGSEFLDFSHHGYKWSLHAHSFIRKEEKLYRVFGTCGDFSFGGAGLGYSRNTGNIRAARAVYGKFMKILESKKGPIAGKKFGL